MTENNGEQPTEPTGGATPPPAAPTPPPASGGGSQYDFDQAKQTLQGANRLDLGIMGAGVIAWIAGFLPFYTVSISVSGISNSASASAYHGFFGWFAVWLALAGAAVVAASLFGIKLPVAVFQAAVGLFVAALICLILALFIFPGGDCGSAGDLGGALGGGFKCDTGRGFGYWLALLAVLAGTALSFMRMRGATSSSSHAA